MPRLIQIERVLVRHRLDDFVRATHLYRPLRFVFFISPWTWFQRGSDLTRGARLRLALEELGPIFVKFGQALSTRRDLLPDDIADELAKLQDNVPPFPGAVARAIIEHSYGAPLDTRLRAFEETPLAAASIAQVHAAKLPGRPRSHRQGAAARHAGHDRARHRGALHHRRHGRALVGAEPAAQAAARSCASTRKPCSMSST